MFRKIFYFLKGSTLLRKLIAINILGIALPVILFTVIYIRGEERKQIDNLFSETQAEIHAEIEGIRENVILLRNVGYYSSKNLELADYLSGAIPSREVSDLEEQIVSVTKYIKFINEKINNISIHYKNDENAPVVQNLFPFDEVIDRDIYIPMISNNNNQFWLFENDRIRLRSNPARQRLVSVLTKPESTEQQVIIEVNMLSEDFFSNPAK